MEISHVIRGEEWLPSLPLHVLLYKALGWTESMPLFAHLPLLLKPTGNGKLSKRDGDKMGFPVFPLQYKSPEGETSRGYREDGYFPEAFVNLLALLGWNPGTEQELFSMDELIQLFSLERVNKSGARFDPEKAKWFNHQYIVQKSNAELAVLFLKLLNEKGITADMAKVEKIVGLVKERVNFVHEIWEQSFFFFTHPTTYDEATVKKAWSSETPELMKKVLVFVQTIEPFNSQDIEHQLKEYINANNLGMGKVMNALRLSLVGASKGPGVEDICEVIGKEETINRINKAITTI
jgi:glutamyl-tRNA synthetase